MGSNYMRINDMRMNKNTYSIQLHFEMLLHMFICFDKYLHAVQHRFRVSVAALRELSFVGVYVGGFRGNILMCMFSFSVSVLKCAGKASKERM